MFTPIRIPDLLADWPFTDIKFNPNRNTICDESANWIKSYQLFDTKVQAAFDRCNFGFLCSVAYPHADLAHFRVACDYMNFAFAFDDVSDEQNGASVHELSAIIKDALSDPSKPRPPGESTIGEVARSFWSKALKFTSPSSARRFVKDFAESSDAVAREAEDRDHSRIRGIDDYLDLRREVIGARAAFDILLLPDDLPDEIISHPSIECLVSGGVDLLILTNDIYSYNKERARGDTHNMVAVVMNEKQLDEQGAMDYVGERYHEIARKFVEDLKEIPKFSEPIDQLVAKYVLGIGNWVTAHIEWCFTTQRYFGTRGQEVRAKLVFELQNDHMTEVAV